MEREQIVREDFPTVRKGWDPDAVRSHLRRIADEPVVARPAGVSDIAAEQVKGVLAAAEAAASEITATARAEASDIVASARAEASELLDRAKSDAGSRTDAARDAAESIVAEAERLRSQVAELATRVSGSSAGASPAAEVPGPVVVPEPGPARVPEPTPDPVPEPTPDPGPDRTPEPLPDPVPEPTPDPVPEPTPDPVPDEPAALDPEPEPVEAANGVSTEDLVAQLKAGGSENGTATAAPAVSSSDAGAARLVAMNMALDGADRDAIAAQIRGDFGEVPGLDGLLDEVIARAGR